MRDERVYELRRAILEAHVYYTPMIPLSLDDVLRFYRLPCLQATREQVAAEWNNLAVNGYLQDIPDSNGQYKRITATGLNQFNQEVKLDLYVWGSRALMMLVVTATIFLLFTTSVGGRPASPGGDEIGLEPAARSGGPSGWLPSTVFFKPVPANR